MTRFEQVRRTDKRRLPDLDTLLSRSNTPGAHARCSSPFSPSSRPLVRQVGAEGFGVGDERFAAAGLHLLATRVAKG